MPTYGRSNVPQNSILDHAGVWENCNHGYLHEVLIKREGIAATLAIIYTQVRTLVDPARLDRPESNLKCESHARHGVHSTGVCTYENQGECRGFPRLVSSPIGVEKGGGKRKARGRK